jgi:DNA end-binding protein Ku
VARPVWSGSISFGLVNVPVKAFTAVRDHDIHFNQFEKGTGARIKYEKVSAKTGKEVDTDDIELGYEVTDGRYVTFEKGEIDELRPESTKAVEVSDFVCLADVDPIYYERTYWLAPADDAAAKAYQLLLAAMEDRGRVGIGSVVMRNKQYLAAIRPLDGALAMSTMRFADEVVPRADVDALPARRAKPDAKAMKLATQIVDSLAADWKPEQYEDTYIEELRRIIKRKDQGKEVVIEQAPAQKADVVDLMAALEASVEAAKAGRGKRGGKDLAGALREAADELVEDVEDDADDADDAAPTRSATKRNARSATKPKKKSTKRSTAKKPARAKAPARKSA